MQGVDSGLYTGLYTVVGSSLCLNLCTALTWAPLVEETLLRSQILFRGSLPMKVNSIKVYLLHKSNLRTITKQHMNMGKIKLHNGCCGFCFAW